MIRLIAAIDSHLGIAKNGKMPWSIPDDEAYFTRQTKTFGGHVLTGGKTFREAYKGRPLAGRHNYILTRRDEAIEGAEVVHDLPQFLKRFENQDLWVAGGSEVFEQVMQLNKADELYLTHIEADCECDQFFPEYDGFVLTRQSEPQEQNGYRFTYAVYKRA
jgi:dihydrofolate reductase